ncbi:MAG: ABC transporter ATP-binding protein [Planctomycetia bacterium]
MAGEPIVEFEKIRKVYKGPFGWGAGLTALDGVDFRMEPGTVQALLGPNRAGKTTLLKILLSISLPTGGVGKRLGRPLTDRSTLARIGYVHENQAFPKYLTASSLLEFYGTLTLLPPADLKSRIPALLERVGLADRGREPISRFSKGMGQRLGLAQALLNDPDLLVLDEPTEGLDQGGRDLLRSVTAERKEAGRSTLLVSHVLPEVERLCDGVLVLDRGKKIFDGSMNDLLTGTDGGRRPLDAALQTLYGRTLS